MCLFLEISPYIGTTGCPHKKGYPGSVAGLEYLQIGINYPNRG